MGDTVKLPTTKPYEMYVPLYPLSAQVLLKVLESAGDAYSVAPQYVRIDIDNFRNQLAAHLQRVERGE